MSTTATVPYFPRLHSETSVAELRWTGAKDKPESPNISTPLRDLLQSFWLSLGGVASPALQRGSESIVIDVEGLIEWLALKVRLENPHSIREYLLRFTELLDVIPKAVGAAKKHFPEAQLVMDVYQDPEIDDNYLVLYIRLKHYDDSVIERLEEAEAEFLNQLVSKRGWIQLTTDFRELEEEDAL
jgi:hypothetical protein